MQAQFQDNLCPSCAESPRSQYFLKGPDGLARDVESSLSIY